ncbi:MAG TPA: SurA N-terminal domain-containing protein [Candidatus Competibacteraceae bacterium]|nr:SurA N-terminal domain-containing protein [Candidatus Competibacteraceae bacterium]HRZ06950.1 SurA N-terminal domain-containing protein [Candidatus Competibacteraceae bacterium]HSA46231.1 SurA N-terminal domain-containing protein [Candidatus Competibacteraceae bacterium]
MLQKIRDHAQGWFAYIIIGLLTIPFAVWGINYYFEGGGPVDAAIVGGSKISLQEYQRAYQQQRQRLQAMMGNNMDPALLEGPRLKQDVLRQLIDERVLAQLINDQGMRVSDQQLRNALLTLPVFQQSGGFNKELYERLLRNQGYTAALFEEGLRQSLATEQLRNGVIASALATPTELEQLIALLKQQREVYLLTLPLAQYVAKVKVEDVAIQNYFAKNAERFVNPEQVRVQFIELKLSNIANPITVGEDELQAAYQAQIAKYGRPEERSASHILVKLPPGAAQTAVDQAQTRAQRIAGEIRSGAKTFDQALQEVRSDPSGQVEGGDLGVISKGMFDNPALENALYALQKPSEVSEPVRMSSGFHILRLDSITPAQVKPFEEVRDSIAQELRQQQAENRFYEITQMLANLGYEHPDSLEPAAKTLELTIQDSDWFNRQGREGIAKQPKVIDSAFSEDVRKRGLNSEPLELEPGHVVMLRVKEYKDATPRTLEESREEIAKILREQQAREALAKDIATLKARAVQGEHLQALAKEFGGEFKNAGLIGRDAPSVDSAVLETVFRLPSPEEGKVTLGSAVLANGDQAVLVVARVVAGKKDDLTEDERKMLTQQLAQQTGSGQFEGLLDSVRVKTKVVMYSDRL